jgi:hypothetical protein
VHAIVAGHPSLDGEARRQRDDAGRSNQQRLHTAKKAFATRRKRAAVRISGQAEGSQVRVAATGADVSAQAVIPDNAELTTLLVDGAVAVRSRVTKELIP